MRTMRKGMGYGLCRVADVGVCYFDVAVDGGWLLAVAFEECVHGVCWGEGWKVCAWSVLGVEG